MRRAHNIGMPEQRIRVRWLLGEHVERCAGHLAGIERHAQRLLVDQAAARAIDDAHPFFHFGERSRVDDVLGLFGERGVQRDEIRTLEQLVELDFVHADIGGALGREERIIGDYAHA